MTIELFLIILLAILLFAFMGIALHMANTIRQLHQYIGELERDLRNSENVLRASGSYKKGNNDSTADHQ